MSDVEHRCYFALSSLGGEHEDGMWWAPEHELVALSKSDPLAGAKQAIRRSWSALSSQQERAAIAHLCTKVPKDNRCARDLGGARAARG